MHLEGTQGELVVGRHENDRGHGLSIDLFQHTEAVQLRHLHVQENQIGFVPSDGGERISPVSAFAEDIDIRLLVEQLANPLSRQRFVVDNQRPNFSIHLCKRSLGIRGDNGLFARPFLTLSIR